MTTKFDIEKMKSYYFEGGAWEEFLEDSETTNQEFFELPKETRKELWAEMPFQFVWETVAYGISIQLKNISGIKFNTSKFYFDLQEIEGRNQRKAFMRLVQMKGEAWMEIKLASYISVVEVSKPWQSQPRKKVAIACLAGGGHEYVLVD